MCKSRYANVFSDCYHFYLLSYLLSVTFRDLKTIIIEYLEHSSNNRVNDKRFLTNDKKKNKMKGNLK